MFLTMLNEKEQKNFLELAVIAIAVDGKIDEREKNIIDVYRKETNLQNYAIQNLDLQALLTEFQASTKKIKRAVLIELAGVLDADDEVVDSEKDWIFNVGREWGFREAEIKKMVLWAQDFNDLLAEGYNYILGNRNR